MMTKHIIEFKIIVDPYSRKGAKTETITFSGHDTAYVPRKNDTYIDMKGQAHRVFEIETKYRDTVRSHMGSDMTISSPTIFTTVWVVSK